MFKEEEELEREQGEAGPNRGRRLAVDSLWMTTRGRARCQSQLRWMQLKSRRKNKRKEGRRGLTWEETKHCELSEVDEGDWR